MKPSAKIGKRFRFRGFSVFPEFLVFPADQDQLQIAFAAVQTFNNVEHRARSVPAKEHDPGWKVWERGPIFFSLLVRFSDTLLIKPRLHHHAGSKEHMIAIVAESERLLLGTFGPADDVFGFALHPEMRRIIGEIGEQSDKWHAGIVARMLSARARLKCGITESTISAGCCCQYFGKHVDRRSVV